MKLPVCLVIAMTLLWACELKRDRVGEGVETIKEEVPACLEWIVARIEVPDGKLWFEVESGFVKISVRHSIGDGYYAEAVGRLPIRFPFPDVFAFKNRSDSEELKVLLEYVDLREALHVDQAEGDIGFRIDIDWKYDVKATQSDDTITVGSVESVSANSKSIIPPTDRLPKRPVSPTSKRLGYQWYVSPMIAAPLDFKKTIDGVAHCVGKLQVKRIPNPPLTTPPPVKNP